jgi:hypothetical protein
MADGDDIKDLSVSVAVTHRVRVKSRTGDSYFRGPRSWPAHEWARAEITTEELELLTADRWLDVLPLPEGDSLDPPALSVEMQLRNALAEIAKLRAELASTRATAQRRGR